MDQPTAGWPDLLLAEHEITTRGPLLADDGTLVEPGWARRPLRDANLERAAPGLLRRLRIKRWDYYGVWTPQWFASATLSHVGYLGLAFVYVVDLRDGRIVGDTRMRPFGRGMDLPRNSDSGNIAYDDGRVHLAFDLTPDARHVYAADAAFDGGRGLTIDVRLATPPSHDSIVMCTPMGGDCFFYNRKLNGLRASGTVTWAGQSASALFGQLDWGRGVWPYRSHWLWASANGRAADGRIIGLNLGAGFGDLHRGTENALFIDGRLHKLGAVTFDCDSRDYTRPWRLRDDAGRLDVTLTVSAERVDGSNVGVLRSEVHQCFGRYAGHVVSDTGERLLLTDLPGFAEEHHARW